MSVDDYKEYKNHDELRKVQLLSTLLMDELDRVCTELGISYQAYSGTAIGAVRHQGFIPWDDDIDISMLREDYEVLLKDGPRLLRPDFCIQNGRTDNFFPAMNSNLSLRNTVCVPDDFSDCPFKYSISIGIFPFDKIPTSPKIFKSVLRRTWFWGRLNFLLVTPTPHIPLHGWKRKIASFVCYVIHYILRIFRISSKFILSKWEKAARTAEKEDTDRRTCFVESDPENWEMDLKDLYPMIRVPFEDITTILPNAYDKLLTNAYGAYMELPSMSERKNHYPSQLDFGKWKDIDVTKGSRQAFEDFGQKN
ncbi:LICD family protein [Atopobium sp. BS2]|uniref:LicD family protein n=1 Tax=Atopobium sp. BS2 TaxID=936550 RepID=UPI0004481827|nr:LicD family protein [Atopobium sp. BS2]EWC94126.1 LICD family protein [Atopobium sp. BS2]